MGASVGYSVHLRAEEHRHYMVQKLVMLCGVEDIILTVVGYLKCY